MSSMALVGNVRPDEESSKGKQIIRKRRKSRSDGKGESETSRKESLSGAIARALVGTLAFVFRAPVRLFRPVKLSSWNLLEAMAKREGSSLSLRYMRTLIRREKSTFLPHLLLPPLLVNTTIGFCLFEAYSLTESRLLAKHYPKEETVSSTDPLLPHSNTPSFTPLWIVAIAGGSAGAAQCIVSAPLDNVRIILSSQMGKHKGNHTFKSHKRHPLGISWRAVARAAILPFAPEITRNKLVNAVKESGQAKASGKGANSKETQRLLWEKRIKRWRGGVHGAGLIMSLARDSVGFSAFFVVFEISRRLAFRASLGVDRILAFWSSSAPLPLGKGERDDVESSDTFHLESTNPGDVSYSQSRTKTGRFIAALVLVFGGAIGAALYEVVGRPAELMRLVIWEGRKAWEEGRRGTRRDSWRHERGRIRVIGARRREWLLLESAGQDLKRGTFLSLRSANRSGTRLTKVQGSVMQRARRPPHPLKLTSSLKSKAPLHETVKQTPVNENKGRKRRTALRIKHRISPRPAIIATPSLESRPSAYTLLLEHAQRTSILRFTSDKNVLNRRQPTPVPNSILLFHTYFIAPFSLHPPAIMQQPKPAQDASKTINQAPKSPKSSKRFLFGNLLHFKYPISNAPGSVRSISQAQVWGSGRLAWALRRLASPYSIGFLAFAWMSGDLT